jgi:plasmid stability protein
MDDDALDCDENDRISVTLPRRLRQRLRDRAAAAYHAEAAEARQLLAWALETKEERAA